MFRLRLRSALFALLAVFASSGYGVRAQQPTQWQDVAVTIDGDSIDLYVNGILTHTVSYACYFTSVSLSLTYPNHRSTCPTSTRRVFSS